MRSIPILTTVLLSAFLPGAAPPSAAAPAASDAPAATVVIDGAVARGGPVDAARLASLPRLSLPVTFGTGTGARSGRYEGVLLWDLLRGAAPIDGPGRNAGLRHTVTVTGRDGYAAAFSFGELDPGGSADPVLLADRDGVPQLVVPGDRTGGRDVCDVVRISVR